MMVLMDAALALLSPLNLWARFWNLDISQHDDRWQSRYLFPWLSWGCCICDYEFQASEINLSLESQSEPRNQFKVEPIQDTSVWKWWLNRVHIYIQSLERMTEISAARGRGAGTQGWKTQCWIFILVIDHSWLLIQNKKAMDSTLITHCPSS